MYAFTIWQPWASLIVAGFKPVEFRAWHPPRSIVGQRIVIHAGRKSEKDGIRHLLIDDKNIFGSCGPGCDVAAIRAALEHALSLPGTMLRGFGLGSAVIGDPERADRYYDRRGLKIGGDGPWNVAWPMLDVEAWDEPVEHRGAQGFWVWPHGEKA